jgi:F-type H+-transporting ATPase subunit epsilon
MSKFPLEIVNPDRLFFEGEVEMVIVKGAEGDLAILKNRAPIVTPLSIGKVRIKQDGVEKVATVNGGYIKVTKEKTVIITDACEWPDEIDVERAEKAKERAEKRLKERSKGVDIDRAELALKRAINRIEVSKL